jgi:hypothetical protein
MQCLPEGRGGRSCSGGWPTARSCGGGGSVFVEKGVAGAFRATGHRGSTRGGPAKVLGELGKSGVHRR